MIKCLVIGETCTDKFVYCKVTRFSPEAPVPVLNPIKLVENPGMSGNVVRNLHCLEEMSVTHLHQKKIITKTRYVDKGSNHMFLRIDEGEDDIDTYERINDYEKYDFVIVSDYAKGFLSDSDLVEIGKKSKLSILDSKRKLNKEIVQNFTFVKLNEKESQLNSELLYFENIIVTLGSDGCRFTGKVFPSLNPQETIDVSGAGDTFTASFIYSLFLNSDIEQSLYFANKMSSIVVSKRGVSTPN